MYVVAENPLEQEFWSGAYRGRPIAVLHRDHVFQHKLAFATAAHAKAWLIKRIDEHCAQCHERALAA